MRTLLVALITIIALSNAGAEIVVITSQDTGVTELTRYELNRYYTYKLKRWHNGTPLRIVHMRKKSPIYTEFVKTVLDIQPGYYERRMQRLYSTGRVEKPTVVNDATEMQVFVATTIGALGYTDSEVLYNSGYGLTVLRIH